MAIAKLTKDQAGELEKLLDAFDKARADLADWVDHTVGEWTDEIDDKSEKWQATEAGAAAIERRDTLAAFADEMPQEPTLDVASLS